ncbi:MAG: hypothetical protein Q9213_000048 [Squamulea squamosa]
MASPHMIPKQAEMDNVVRRIYRGLETKSQLKNTILVLCGDHGMNDAGNHGGSAEGETSPALVFISPKLSSISQGVECPATPSSGDFGFYGKVDQSDVAPTLAGLLGFPVPRNNMGVFIPDFLRFWAKGDSVRLLKQNAEQVLGVVQETFSTVSFDDNPHSEACEDIAFDGARLACLWFRVRTLGYIKGQQHDEKTEEAALHAFLVQGQKVMSNTASNYSIGKLYLGTATGALAMLWTSVRLSSVLLQKWIFGAWFSLVILAYGITMFASSYVEEEHQYWYLVASTWLWWLGMKQGRVRSRVRSVIGAVVPLVFMRVLRGWNQTGQKYASQPDIARGVFPHHNYLLWSLVFVSYLVTLVKMSIPSHAGKTQSLFSVTAMVVCMMGLAFRISFTMADSPELLRGIQVSSAFTLGDLNLVMQTRIVFCGIVFYAVGIIISDREGRSNSKPVTRMSTPVMPRLISAGVEEQRKLEALHGVLTLFLMTQSRVTNVPLFALFEIQWQIIASMDLSDVEISLTSIILQYSSFFAFGGSNSISSVDLSNAYNGVSGYNAGAVAILTFCSNWAGPLWWTTAALLLLGRRQPGASKSLRQFQLLSTCFIANANMFVMVACTLLRTHLFIWTVFSPKYLYTLAWGLGQHLCINMTASTLYIWLGT